MEAPSKSCCQNKKCPNYGKHGAKNLTVCGRFGKNKHIRLLYCRTCKQGFSERKGMPLFGMKLDKEKTISVFKHISEGCGVRKTGRLVSVHPDTVTRYSRAVGDHAQAIHDELVAFSPRNKRGSVRRKVGICPQERKTL